MLNNQNKTPELIEDLGSIYATSKSKSKSRFGIYKCPECTNTFRCRVNSINNGHTKSCGCLKVTHSKSSTKIYAVWSAMVMRVTNPKNKHYKNYGGRGIDICNSWMKFESFYEDMGLTYKQGLSTDRIDNEKGYNKENCRWTTREVQNRNTRIIVITNKTGYRGVHFDKFRNKYKACISLQNKNKCLGRYETALEAAIARDTYIVDNNLEHTLNGIL